MTQTKKGRETEGRRERESKTELGVIGCVM